LLQIDQPKENDNRSYDYTGFSDAEREEYVHIVQLVSVGARVIDLGCGNGTLLRKLERENHTTGVGVEVSKSGVRICREKGLDVRQGRIDEPLPFQDNEFDYAICSVTIQMVIYPEVLLREMKRISRYQIVSFPNFGFYRNRLDMLLHGHMPTPMLFGYRWYSTGHIHQLSMMDFLELVSDVGGLQVTDRILEHSRNPFKDLLMQKFPNLFQVLFIYLLKKTE
jgi:methionine biosynthesis protein MetW